LLFWE